MTIPGLTLTNFPTKRDYSDAGWLAGRLGWAGLGAGLMGGEGKTNLRHPSSSSSSSSSPTIYSDRRRRMDSTTVETGLFCRMYLYLLLLGYWGAAAPRVDPSIHLDFREEGAQAGARSLTRRVK